VTSDDDLALALEFLRGKSELNNRGGFQLRFLSGEEERRARAALARILLSDEPVPRRLRHTLAWAFDPQTRPHFFEAIPDEGSYASALNRFLETTLVPVRPRARKGARRKEAHKSKVAMEILLLLEHVGFNEACTIVAEKFGYKDSSTVRKYWYERCADVQAVFGTTLNLKGK
jgi:hypothetical protein